MNEDDLWNTLSREDQHVKGRNWSVRMAKQMLTTGGSLSSAPPMATRDYSGPETILVVDDDPALLALVDLLLGRNGYLVESVDDPEKAWDMISADRAQISLLLTDVGIPCTIGGVALAERVRYSRPDLPVLLMTGPNLLEDEAPEVISFWDEKLLRKPFSVTGSWLPSARV